MKKREKIKGRGIAIFGMILLILLSVPVGTWVSLVRERDAAEVLYTGDKKKDGLLADLTAGSGKAADMITLAGKYKETDAAAVQAVQNARDALTKANTPGEKAACYRTLTEKVNALYSALCAVEMSADNAAYREEIIADYKMNADFIERSEYNTRAEKFNTILENTPAHFLAALVGIEPLELFR